MADRRSILLSVAKRLIQEVLDWPYNTSTSQQGAIEHCIEQLREVQNRLNPPEGSE